MAYMVIELNLSGLAIADLNDRCANAADKSAAVNGAMDLISAIAAGAQKGTIQVTSRDTSASVATSGAGSTQNSF